MFEFHSPHSHRSRRSLCALATLLVLGVALVACEPESPPPSEKEAKQILEGQPELFIERDKHWTLEGLDGIELGQPRDEALEALSEICPQTMEYRAGNLGDNAWFRGCEFERPHDGVVSVRVGFWPKLDDRVSTLEIKRLNASAPVVSERFRQLVGEVESEVVRSAFVQMRGKKYQMMADWDEGKNGPAHIAAGFNPDNLDAIDVE